MVSYIENCFTFKVKKYTKVLKSYVVKCMSNILNQLDGYQTKRGSLYATDRTDRNEY